MTAHRRKILVVEPAPVAANVFSGFKLPLLGPMYLGTILAQEGHDVRVVAEDLLDRPLQIGDLDADDLLLSSLTPTVERGYELARMFKRVNPGGRVIMGGPHVSFLPEEALQVADTVVCGEGETIIADLIAHGSDARVVTGAPVADLDSLPLLKWSLLEGYEKLRIQPIMTSRGCPFSCNFCSVTAMFGRHYRAMSPERVLAEVEANDLPEIFFYDDNFTAQRRRSHAIMDGLLRRKRPHPQWTAQMRADVTRDKELCDKMYAAGCRRVYVGFESVNAGSLKELHKGQSPEDIRRAIRVFHDSNIAVHGMFIFGTDADDADTIAETTRFVHQEQVDSVQYMVFTPLPGTEMFHRLESEGRLLHRIWRYYDASHVVFRPKKLSPLALQEMSMEAYAGYYNVVHALNEGLETAVASLFRLMGHAPAWLGHPTLRNAGLKVMGAHIVKKWWRFNGHYVDYLRDLGMARPLKGRL